MLLRVLTIDIFPADERLCGDRVLGKVEGNNTDHRAYDLSKRGFGKILKQNGSAQWDNSAGSLSQL